MGTDTTLSNCHGVLCALSCSHLETQIKTPVSLDYRAFCRLNKNLAIKIYLDLARISAIPCA
jgi:hypothetical protein